MLKFKWTYLNNNTIIELVQLHYLKFDNYRKFTLSSSTLTKHLLIMILFVSKDNLKF